MKTRSAFVPETLNPTDRVRYEYAWDDSGCYGADANCVDALIRKGVWPDRRLETRWNSLRRFAHSRSGRVIIAAPIVGALGAWIVIRRRS